ncbi:MAG: FAD-dependent monooxygenase [Cyanobacteria bacterium P01_A01_bin.114]
MTADTFTASCAQKTPPKSLRVGVVGAGTSGLYLTSLLKRQGHSVTLFEQSDQPRAEGCGIMLVSAGMQALFAGNPKVCDAVVRAGAPAKSFEFRSMKDKVVNVHIASYEDNNELTGMLIHRGAILEALLNHLPQGCLQTHAKLQSVEQTDEAVTAHFADGRTWQGDVLVGADGIFSALREYVNAGVKPNYLGDIVWRGIVPDDEFCTDGNFKVYIRTQGIYANFFDIGFGQTHWGFFIEKDQQPDEVGKGRPNDVSMPTQELSKLPEVARRIIQSTPAEDIKCRFSYDIDTLPTLQNGRIILIGDAAHAKSPTRARGMTAGLEDALALSRHLSVAGSSVDQMLTAFQAERLPIVHEYQRSSREISMKTGRLRKQAA